MKYYNFVTKVQSKSNPDKVYTVKLRNDGLLTCNCPAWIYNIRRDRTCKHVDEVKKAGFTADEKGRFIIGTTQWGGKVPVFCTAYPDKCDTCHLRFLCYTERSPEFTTDQLHEAGIGFER